MKLNIVKITSFALIGDGVRRLFRDNLAVDANAETGFFDFLQPNRTDAEKKVGYGLALAEIAIGALLLLKK